MKKISLLIVVLFISIGCPEPCGESADEVSIARSLSDQRLQKLVADTGMLLQELTPDLDADRFYVDSSRPEFVDLDPVEVRIHGSNLLIRLRGCLDHYVDMIVVDSLSDNPRVVLHWGEHDTGKEVLWSAK